MTSVGIIGLGAYVPPHEMSNEDWAEIVETSDEWITTKTGMKKRRIADADTHTSDLAVEACKLALDDAGLTPADIDLVILATSSPDVPLSSTAGIVQHKLGCVDCGAFDINAVCAGWVHALDVGARFVGTPGYDHVLVWSALKSILESSIGRIEQRACYLETEQVRQYSVRLRMAKVS